MDVLISQKEEMMQPNGLVDVISSGINDFFLIEETNDGQLQISDVEIITDVLEEEKDRTVFAVIRQRGQDPIAPYEGVQWAEAMLNEIPVPLLMQQIVDEAAKQSSYVSVSFETITVDGAEQLSVAFNTADISAYT